VLAKRIGVDVEKGLSDVQVQKSREQFGANAMPESPQTGFFSLLLDALSETILLILIAAAAVSLAVGLYEDPENGYVEGAAIFIAVFLVSNIQAFNDYSKELKFRELEASSANDQRASVLRNGAVELINPADLVVGDIICLQVIVQDAVFCLSQLTYVFVPLQAGDMVPADCAIIDHHIMRANESALTGEPDDLRKSFDGDCFLLSSTLITEGDGCKALVLGIGLNSQWGKIKANLVTEAENTPLQDKLDDMAQQVCMPFVWGILHVAELH
jgi:magnesium-transporting ATPase (P-type)